MKMCSRAWASFDSVTDKPVPQQLQALLASFRDSLTPLTVRDPTVWRQSRLRQHRYELSSEWRVETPCGGPDASPGVKLRSVDAEHEIMIYDAWAVCIATHRPWLKAVNTSKAPLERPLVFNLFTELEADVIERICVFYFKTL